MASITKRNKSLFKVMAPAFEETAFTCWLHGIKAGTQLTPELIAAIAEELK